MSCDVDTSLISRNERPLRWTYTEGVSLMKSKYRSCVFKKAAQVFALVMHCDDSHEIQKRCSLYRAKQNEMPDFDSLEQKRQVLELVFGTLLYDQVYRTVLDNRSFFYQYPELQKLSHLTIVVLHDMQSRKLLPGICDCESYPDSNVRDVENALLNFRLKIGAEIAKIRIENHATTFHQLRSPEFIRFPDPCRNNNTIWGWVNSRKKNIPTVINMLKASGLKADEVKSVSDTSLELTDVFSVRLNNPSDLLMHPSVEQNKFIVQDVSCCIAPQCLVNTLLQQCRVALGQKYMSPHDRRVATLLYIPCPPLYPVLGPWDVAVSDVGNGLTAAHLASLLHSFGFRGRVLAFGGGCTKEQLKIRNGTAAVCVPGVQVVQKPMTDFSLDDNILQRVRAVLVQPKCTKSGVIDPINYLCSEGDVTSFFRGLYEKQSNTEELYQSQMNLLKFCLKLPKVQVVVYATHSMNPRENQDIVQGSIEDINTIAEPCIATADEVQLSSCSGDEAKLESIPKVIRMNTVFEISPVPVNAEGYILKRSQSSPYIKIHPENGKNGCFVAAITRNEIPESFDPEADGDSEADLAILFKDSASNEIGRSYSDTIRALETECSQDEGSCSFEDNDLDNESTQEKNNAEAINEIMFLTGTPKNKGKKAGKKSNKKRKKKKAATVATRKTANYSQKVSHHRTCFSATPSAERPKANSRQSERLPDRITHSRLSRYSSRVSKKEESSVPKLETLTLNHFVAGKNQTLHPKFRTFLNAVEKSKTGPKWTQEVGESKLKEKSAAKRTPSRRRKRSRSLRSKIKSEKLPFDLRERKSSVKLKGQLSGPFNIITNFEALEPPEEPDRIYNYQDPLSDFSDDSSEDKDSLDEFSIAPLPSWKPNPISPRRQRYERHQKPYQASKEKKNLDEALSAILRPPEAENNTTKSNSKSPSSVVQWVSKLPVEQSQSNFDNLSETRSSICRDIVEEFDVYLPETEILRIKDSMKRTAKTTSNNNPRIENNGEDIDNEHLWLMRNSIGTRFREGKLALNKKPLSFRNAAHVVTPELRLPASYKPELQYEKEDRIWMPYKRTPPPRENKGKIN